MSSVPKFVHMHSSVVVDVYGHSLSMAVSHVSKPFYCVQVYQENRTDVHLRQQDDKKAYKGEAIKRYTFQCTVVGYLDCCYKYFLKLTAISLGK